MAPQADIDFTKDLFDAANKLRGSVFGNIIEFK